MAKQTLTQTWIYQGQRYGPGEVDLPKDVADALEARGAFGEPAPPTSPPLVSTAQHPSDGQAAGGPRVPSGRPGQAAGNPGMVTRGAGG